MGKLFTVVLFGKGKWARLLFAGSTHLVFVISSCVAQGNQGTCSGSGGSESEILKVGG